MSRSGLFCNLLHAARTAGPSRNARNPGMYGKTRGASAVTASSGFRFGYCNTTIAARAESAPSSVDGRSEEHTSELQSQSNLVCRLLLEKKKNKKTYDEQDK